MITCKYGKDFVSKCTNDTQHTVNQTIKTNLTITKQDIFYDLFLPYVRIIAEENHIEFEDKPETIYPPVPTEVIDTTEQYDPIFVPVTVPYVVDKQGSATDEELVALEKRFSALVNV
jgi:hypothetical protein